MNGILLAIAAAIAVSYGQMYTPEQFECRYSAFGGYVMQGMPGVIRQHNQYFYDYANKQAAAFINYVNNDFKGQYHYIIKDTTRYAIDLKTGACSVTPMGMPFVKSGIPASAKKTCDYTLGEVDNGVKVSGYTVGTKTGSVFLAVSKHQDGTINPILENVQGVYKFTKYVMAYQYGDISRGISNTTVFDIPVQCKYMESDPVLSDFFGGSSIFGGF